MVLRVFIGKPGNDVVEQYSDEELSELAVEEIQHIMRFSAKPEWVAHQSPHSLHAAI